ncbi:MULTISPECIES: hypothetical protein [Kitasatospora]|uniref:Uncharacterized protein n=1 Tax=Kitasatospora setae (strain ATCC 33774 / DSM 43861 / JCM 3304 / KCC A-0304 / NBRC 14216 / KM-6054) TaxID=452652 RepID=E4N9U3_KITSK|nr:MULTISPECIES: hypothetical protein [Kitasatospora]BAJ27974.1 hypothetical protein KSE_21510 [Kitasatospora setae KM-6054]
MTGADGHDGHGADGPGAGARRTNVPGAVLTCGPVVLFDGWLLTVGVPLVAVPMFLVLLGALFGAATGRPNASASVRLYRAGVGALVTNLLLVLVLLFLLWRSEP